MLLRFEIKRKLAQRSERVKSVDLHHTEPWVLASLYTGTVCIWNYQTQVSFLLGIIPIFVAWLYSEFLEYKKTAALKTGRNSDISLVELGNNTVKEDDRVALLEGVFSNQLLLEAILRLLHLQLSGLHPNRKRLDWNARMKKAAGATRGLAYMHDQMNPPVIYRDLKCSNILLDEDYHAKL